MSERLSHEEAATPRWKVWIAAWPVTAVFILSNAATPLYVLWQQDIGFSDGTLTVIFTSYIIGLLVTLLVAGVAADRLGRKPVLLPALILAIVACLLFATASSVSALVVARFLSGVAVGAIVSAGMAAVTDVGGATRTRLASLLASARRWTGTLVATSWPGRCPWLPAISATCLVWRWEVPSSGRYC